MATDTFEARGINSVVWQGRPVIKEMRANGTDIKPGYLVTTEGETHPDIDICVAGERAIGVVLERYDVDIDTAYDDDDEHVPVLIFSDNKNVGFWGIITANNACTINTLYQAAASGFLVPWTYTDATETSDSLVDVVAVCREYQATDASDDKLRRFMVY